LRPARRQNREACSPFANRTGSLRKFSVRRSFKRCPRLRVGSPSGRKRRPHPPAEAVRGAHHSREPYEPRSSSRTRQASRD
jgi:hypothetical protein